MIMYTYEGTLSRTMNLDTRKVNSVDGDGLWVTVWDEEDMECELVIDGLTPDVLYAALADTASRDLVSYRPSAPVALLLTSVLVQPHKSPGTQGLIMAASLIMAQETGADVEECATWVVEEIQERMANR